MAILSALEKFLLKSAPKAKAVGQGALGIGKSIGNVAAKEVEANPKLAALLAGIGGAGAGAAATGGMSDTEDEDEQEALRRMLGEMGAE